MPKRLEGRRLEYFKNRVRRCATTYREVPLLWVHEAEGALRLWYGGFWRSILGQIRWYLRVQWASEWGPMAVARRAWFWWHELRGHFRHSDGRRHWHTCCLPDDFGLDDPKGEDYDDCVEAALPRWLRFQ